MNLQNLLNQLDRIGFQVLSTLLSVLWQSSILLLVAAALAYFLRNRSAAARHAVWTAAVLVIPLLTLLSFHAERWSPAAEIAAIPAYAPPRSVNAPAPVESATTANAPATTQSADPTPLLPVSVPWDYPWALGLAGYLAVAGTLLFWMLAGRFRMRGWILDGASVLDNRILDTFAESGERLGLSREILLLEHPGVPAPLVCRVFRPAVVLPAGFADGLSDSELRAVALHELAHIKRRDTMVFGLVALVRAVFFFQPLLWIAARRISFLAEVTCDSASLEHEDDPVAYAGLLTRVAAGLPVRALSTEMAAGILFSRSAFFRRVRVILSGQGGRVRKLSRWTLAGIILALSVSLGIAICLPLGENNSPEEKVGISGRVLYENTPVTGADIYLVNKDYHAFHGSTTAERITRSSRNGRFTTKIPPLKENCSRFLVAVHPKYALGWTRAMKYVEAEDIVIVLNPPSSVSGFVHDSEGRPFRGGEVRISTIRLTKQTDFRIGELPLDVSVPGTSVRTDNQGRFLFTRIPEKSECFFLPHIPDYACIRSRGGSAGSDTTAVVISPEGSIEGRVLLGDGMPAKQIEVKAGSRSVTLWGNTSGITDDKGYYRITGLPSGKYYAFLDIEGIGNRWAAAPRANISVESGKAAKADFRCETGGIITGRVTDSITGKPISDQDVFAYCLLKTEKSDNNPGFIAVGTGCTDKNGFYRLHSIPGDIIVRTFARRDFLMNGYEAPSRGHILVTEGGTVEKVDLQITQRIDVQGAILLTDGRPAAKVRIIHPEREWETLAVSDKGGRFTIQNLDPGKKYSLIAYDAKKSMKGSVSFSAGAGIPVTIVMKGEQ